MKLRQTLALAVFLAVLMLGTIGHAEQSAMIQDVGIGQESGTRWDCTGRWYVTYAEYQGVPYDPSILGENMVLQINPDGTAEGMTQGVVEACYTWFIEDECLQVYQDSVRIETCYAMDGHLVSIDGGAVIIFGRNVSAEAGIPAVVPAASLDAFDGTWGNACILKGDVWIPQSLSHMYTGIVIDDGMMALFFSVGQSGLFDQPAGSCQMTLKDGMLYDDDGQYVALHEDGSLSLNTGGEVIYLRKKSPESSTQPEQTTTRVLSGQNTIAAGGYHTAAVREDGTVMAVGSNEYGECDVSGWTDIVAISAGSYHTVGLKADGTVIVIGKWANRYNVSGWTDITAISAGSSHIVGLKADGTVVAEGPKGCGECDVSGWRDIVAISAGEHHTVGRKADGTVVAVGCNSDGQCNIQP